MTSPSLGDVIVRDANPGDASAIAALMCQLGYPTSESEMEQRLAAIFADANFRTFVAVVGGKVCGMIGTVGSPSHEHNDLSGRIIALVVSESVWRRGMARRLVEKAEEDFARRHIARITLTTRLTREGAHRFYERLGYERNGYRYAKTLAGA